MKPSVALDVVNLVGQTSQGLLTARREPRTGRVTQQLVGDDGSVSAVEFPTATRDVVNGDRLVLVDGTTYASVTLGSSATPVALDVPDNAYVRGWTDDGLVFTATLQTPHGDLLVTVSTATGELLVQPTSPACANPRSLGADEQMLAWVSNHDGGSRVCVQPLALDPDAARTPVVLADLPRVPQGEPAVPVRGDGGSDSAVLLTSLNSDQNLLVDATEQRVYARVADRAVRGLPQDLPDAFCGGGGGGGGRPGSLDLMGSPTVATAARRPTPAADR